MTRNIVALTLAACILAAAVPATALAKEDGKAEYLFEIARRLMAKGDEATVALARVLKAETYAKKLNDTKSAIAEIDKLETEVTDKELLMVANAIKMVLLKQTEQDPQKVLSGMDAVIAAAKKRMATTD